MSSSESVARHPQEQQDVEDVRGEVDTVGVKIELEAPEDREDGFHQSVR